MRWYFILFVLGVASSVSLQPQCRSAVASVAVALVAIGLPLVGGVPLSSASSSTSGAPRKWNTPQRSLPVYNALQPDPFKWPVEPPRILDPNPRRLHPDPSAPGQLVGMPRDPLRPYDIFRPGMLGTPFTNFASPFQAYSPLHPSNPSRLRDKLEASSIDDDSLPHDPTTNKYEDEAAEAASQGKSTKLDVGIAAESEQCPLARVLVRVVDLHSDVQRWRDPLLPGALDSSAVVKHLAAYSGLADLQARESGGANGDFLEPAKVPVVQVAQHFFSCWDGRAKYALMGVPGGDAGELLLALAVMEASRPLLQALTAEQVSVIVEEHIAGREHFYMHTDAQAMRDLSDACRCDPLHPRNDTEREHIVKLSSAPQHVGCSYLRLLLTEPGFGVRVGLVQEMIRAVVALRLDEASPLQRRIVLPVLQGYAGREKAIVSVLSDAEGGATCQYSSPLLVPQVDNVQLRLYHAQAAYTARARMAQWISAREPNHSDEAVLGLFDLINELGGKHLHLARQHLAAELPSFTATFTPQGEVFGPPAVPAGREANLLADLPPLMGGVRQGLGPDAYLVPVQGPQPDLLGLPLGPGLDTGPGGPRVGPAPRQQFGANDTHPAIRPDAGPPAPLLPSTRLPFIPMSP